MLDYETDVKQHIVDLLAGNPLGKGRIESAIFHTFQSVYEKGHAEGLTMGLAQNDAKVETLERQFEKSQELLAQSWENVQAYRNFWLETVEELNKMVEKSTELRTQVARLKWELGDLEDFHADPKP